MNGDDRFRVQKMTKEWRNPNHEQRGPRITLIDTKPFLSFGCSAGRRASPAISVDSCLLVVKSPGCGAILWPFFRLPSFMFRQSATVHFVELASRCIRLHLPIPLVIGKGMQFGHQLAVFTW